MDEQIHCGEKSENNNYPDRGEIQKEKSIDSQCVVLAVYKFSSLFLQGFIVKDFGP